MNRRSFFVWLVHAGTVLILIGIIYKAASAGTVSVPIAIEPEQPPIMLKDFEVGDVYGSRGAIQVGGAYAGERCWIGTPEPGGEAATVMLNTEPITHTYVAFWAKADKACVGSLSVMGPDGRVSHATELRLPDGESLTTEWRFYKVPVSAFGGIAQILHMRFQVNQVADILIDDVMAITPVDTIPGPEPPPPLISDGSFQWGEWRLRYVHAVLFWSRFEADGNTVHWYIMPVHLEQGVPVEVTSGTDLSYDEILEHWRLQQAPNEAEVEP